MARIVKFTVKWLIVFLSQQPRDIFRLNSPAVTSTADWISRAHWLFGQERNAHANICESPESYINLTQVLSIDSKTVLFKFRKPRFSPSNTQPSSSKRYSSDTEVNYQCEESNLKIGVPPGHPVWDWGRLPQVVNLLKQFRLSSVIFCLAIPPHISRH